MDSEKWLHYRMYAAFRGGTGTMDREISVPIWEKKISKHTAELIVSRVGFQMDLLSCELDKLIGYTGERRLLQKKMWR